MTVSTPSACSPARTGTASSAALSVREASSGAASRSAQRSASGSGGERRRPRLGLAARACRPARGRVEGHAVVAEVALHAPHGQVERAASARRPRPCRRRARPAARSAPPAAAGGRSSAGRAGTSRPGRRRSTGAARRASVKPPGLSAAPSRPISSPSATSGHEHDRLRLGQQRDLLGEPRVGAGLVDHVGAAAARAPQAAVLRPRHVAERPRPLVRQPVHRQRGLHRARRRVLQRDAHDRGADQGRRAAGSPCGRTPRARRSATSRGRSRAAARGRAPAPAPPRGCARARRAST